MVSVALAPVDELGFIPGQESQRMLRLYITGMFLFVQHAFLLARSSVVLNHLRMVLVTVQFDDVDVLKIGRPDVVG